MYHSSCCCCITEGVRDNRGHIRPIVWNSTLRTCDRLNKLSPDHFLLLIPPWHPVWALTAHWSQDAVTKKKKKGLWSENNGSLLTYSILLAFIHKIVCVCGGGGVPMKSDSVFGADRDKDSSRYSQIIHAYNGFKLEVMSYFWPRLCQQSGPENTP